MSRTPEELHVRRRSGSTTPRCPPPTPRACATTTGARPPTRPPSATRRARPPSRHAGASSRPSRHGCRTRIAGAPRPPCPAPAPPGTWTAPPPAARVAAPATSGVVVDDAALVLAEPVEASADVDFSLKSYEQTVASLRGKKMQTCLLWSTTLSSSFSLSIPMPQHLILGRKCGLPHPTALLSGIVISNPIIQSLKHYKNKK